MTSATRPTGTGRSAEGGVKTIHIAVSIDPRSLNSFAALDRALDMLRKQAVDHAAGATVPSTIALTFEMDEIKVPA